MTKESFLVFCQSAFDIAPDYPFETDFDTAVFRHTDNHKWFALLMKVSRRKFGFDSDEIVEIVNLKLPPAMFGSFGIQDGVFPAYHMNKHHWISVLLPDATEELIGLLTYASYEITKAKPHGRKKSKI